MARAAVDLLARRPGHTVSVHEATAGGLISAALLASPGASQYYRNGRVTSTSRPPNWLPDAVAQEIAASRGQTAGAYRDGKTAAALAMARHTQRERGTTWCLAESGACGPTFPVPGLSAGFTAICVTGPVERGILVQGPAAADREANMWLFTQAALTLLAECIAATEEPGSAAEAPSDPSATAEGPGAGPDSGGCQADAVIPFTDDRYGGVVAEAPPTAGDDPGRFERALDGLLDRWRQQGKRGCWMKVPIQAADVIPLCVRRGFVFHHTRPDYCMLTRWLPGDAEQPDKLPAFANTQIGVGGCVLNDRNEVLLVTERISPIAAGQGLWKVPGGLTNPGESLYDCAVREVFEETGVHAEAESIICFRHAHRYQFDVDDLYFVALLRCSPGKEAIKIDPQEIGEARWVTAEELETLYANKKIGTMMKHALDCALRRSLPITSTRVASLRGPPTDVFSATGTNLPRNPPDP